MFSNEKSRSSTKLTSWLVKYPATTGDRIPGMFVPELAIDMTILANLGERSTGLVAPVGANKPSAPHDIVSNTIDKTFWLHFRNPTGKRRLAPIINAEMKNDLDGSVNG